MVDVSVIIVSWNVNDLLMACLASIIQSPVAINTTDGDKPIIEIIVVDSASNDDTVKNVRTQHPDVRLMPQPDNIGFTRGNNIGFAAAQGRYLLMLNPDTEIIGDAIGQMMRYMDTHPEVGLIGPHTLNTDGSTQSTRRVFPSKTIAFFESTWLQSIAPQHILNDFYLSTAPDEAILDVDWVQGSALMTRREIYDDIGGLDHAYIMFYEELDWCKRIRDAGWCGVYLGDAQIIHHGGKSTEQIGAHKHIWFQESKLRYFRKFHGDSFATLLRIFLLIGYGWQLCIESFKQLIGHKADLRKERIKTYVQVLRSGLKAS